MTINIQAQWKTCIESKSKPQAKHPKTQITKSWAVRPLKLAVDFLPSGQTSQMGGLTATWGGLTASLMMNSPNSTDSPKIETQIGLTFDP